MSLVYNALSLNGLELYYIEKQKILEKFKGKSVIYDSLKYQKSIIKYDDRYVCVCVCVIIINLHSFQIYNFLT